MEKVKFLHVNKVLIMNRYLISITLALISLVIIPAPTKTEAGIFRQRARVSSPGIFRQLTFAPSARGRR